MQTRLFRLGVGLALILGLLSASLGAQNYVWSALNGIPTSPQAVIGVMKAGDGSQAAPSITFATQVATGFYFAASSLLGFTAANYTSGGFSATGVVVDTASSVGWRAGTFSSSANDVELYRSAAAVLDVRGTSVTLGALHTGYVVETNIATKAPSVLESREVYNDVADGDGSIITLPDDPVAGWSTIIAAVSGQTITINTGTGEKVWLAGTDCGTNITGADTGATLFIIAVVGGSGGTYHAIGSGTWSC